MRHIVVIDDLKEYQTFARGALEKYFGRDQVQIACYYTAQGFIQDLYAGVVEPDVVISDYELHEATEWNAHPPHVATKEYIGNGVELFEYLHPLLPQTAFILMSHYPEVSFDSKDLPDYVMFFEKISGFYDPKFCELVEKGLRSIGKGGGKNPAGTVTP